MPRKARVVKNWKLHLYGKDAAKQILPNACYGFFCTIWLKSNNFGPECYNFLPRIQQLLIFLKYNNSLSKLQQLWNLPGEALKERFDISMFQLFRLDV